VIVHLFVVWKFDSYKPRNDAQTVNSVNRTAPEIVKIVVDQTDEWVQTIEATRATLAAKGAAVQQLEGKQRQLQERLDQMSRTMEILSKKESALVKMESDLASVPSTEGAVAFSDGTVAPNLSRLQGILMNIPDLGVLEEEDLRRAFSIVQESVGELIHSAESLNWSAVNQVLQENYPEKVSQVSACAAKLSQDSDSAKDVDTTAVTVDDLVVRQDEIKAIWDTVYEDGRPLPLYGDGSIGQLEAQREELVQGWLQRVRASFDEALETAERAAADQQSMSPEQASDNAKKQSTCAKTDDILAILEAGLDAVHRKKDLRESLRVALSARKSDMANVILDAVLPLDNPRPSIEDSRSVSLRHYLDTSVLRHDVPSLIQKVLDLVGGYYDSVDQIIDSLPENVGEASVEYLLDAAGQFDLTWIKGGSTEKPAR
jgi:hypothetical protein